jgi:putative membrane protein
MRILINILLRGIAVFVTSYILPGVQVRDFTTAIVAAVVLGIANAVVKPLLILFTLPITLLTLGLFTFVINALLVMLVSSLVDGFNVSGFFWALIFSFVLTFISSVLDTVF